MAVSTLSDILFFWSSRDGVQPRHPQAAQASFTRNGQAFEILEGGRLKKMAVDTPRLSHTPYELDADGTLDRRPGLLLELSRDNLISDPEDVSAASWGTSGSPVITTDDAVAPDGSVTADKVEDDDTTAFEPVNQTASVADDSKDRVASVFVRKQESFSSTVDLELRYSGGTTTVAYSIQLNPATGATDTSRKSAAPTDSGVEDYGDYWRLWVAGANNATGNTTLQFKLFPAINTSGADGSSDSSATGAIHAWGANAYLGAFPTSYIDGDGSGIDPRSTEDFHWSNSGVDGSEPWAFYLAFVARAAESEYDDNERMFEVADSSSNTPRIAIRSRGAGPETQIIAFDSGGNLGTAQIGLGFGVGDFVEIAGAVRNSSSDLYIVGRINGGSLSSGTGSGPTNGLEEYSDDRVTMNASGGSSNKIATHSVRMLAAKAASVDAALDGTEDAAFLSEMKNIVLVPGAGDSGVISTG